MNTFEEWLEKIIHNDQLHAKWLNTLSYLENCGARKIAACEHPTLVKEDMLKHAAEEFRHALYLKKQIGKVISTTFLDYSPSLIVGNYSSYHYLDRLECSICRYLSKSISKELMQQYAYLFVTYAIECRAEKLYPIYHNLLRKNGSKVTVKSILLEEKEHLEDMKNKIIELQAQKFIYPILEIENKLFNSLTKTLFAIFAK